MSNLKKHLVKNLVNMMSWHTKRKIIVFQSDDWGAARMHSKKSYEVLLKKGYPVDKCPYNANDRIENNDDLDYLTETLLKYKDINNNPANFTLNTIMSNPDFEKIRAANFQEFFYEDFHKTIGKYQDSNRVVTSYKEGIQNKIFTPQLHGREHLNVRLWMERLQKKEKRTLEAFDQNMFALTDNGIVGGRRGNLDAYGNYNLVGTLYNYENNIAEAQAMFNRFYSFKSSTFIAPCYVWNPELEKILLKNDIQGIQSTHVQKSPLKMGYDFKRIYHFTGQSNKFGQNYLVRNVNFEPTENPKVDVVNQALSQINTAFKFKSPAIICSHRVNFIGSLNPRNREQGIEKLNQLLSSILKNWPNVEFMSSDALLKLIQLNN